MLLRVADKVLVCLDHAAELRELSLREPNPARKAEYRDLERKWIKLADSYQLSDRIDQFIPTVKLRTREPHDKAAN